ncbi:MarR family winged helix-turn-helix transcriptional regulator [Brevibacillus sp. H7]|uniref:MarR family winged helix-turn-helix transcriptional regulator n=1 Tax=Brevibacillus sp. H7 TaxID=3349138 RepID=UPI0038146E33
MNHSSTEQLNHYFTSIYYFLHYPHQDGITHQAVRLLQHIEKRENVTIGDLAKLLAVSHNTASEHVKRLIQNGLVSKERSREDERRVYVRITEKGQEVLKLHTQLDDGKLVQILERLPDEKREKVLQGFAILAEEAKRCFS